MPKLGHSENVPDVSIEKMVAEHNEEPSSEDSENERSLPHHTTPITEPVHTEPKKKRKMSEKQLEILRRGREKRMELNRERKKRPNTSSASCCTGILALGSTPTLNGNTLCTTS